MKVDVIHLTNFQLIALLAEFNRRMAAMWNKDGYTAERDKYRALLGELRRRRTETTAEIPLVIKKDLNNQFGVINRDYFNKLELSDQKTYIDWKWTEL